MDQKPVTGTELLDGHGSLTGEANAMAGSDFRSSQGRPLKVICGIEQIVNIEGAEVGSRVTPTVVDTQRGRVLRTRMKAKLDATDFWEIDKAVLAAAKPLLENPERPVIVPMSFHSISRPRARERLFESVELTPDKTTTAMIAEIVGMDQGTPEGRLTDAVQIIRPFCSAVFVEALSASLVKGFVINGVGGVTLDLRDVRRGERALISTLKAFGEAGSGFVRTLVARGLPSAEFLEAAHAAGVTHASVRRAAAR
jgi:hypothetical protein